MGFPLLYHQKAVQVGLAPHKNTATPASAAANPTKEIDYNEIIPYLFAFVKEVVRKWQLFG